MEPNQQRAGILFGITAFFLWGTLPVYWKLLSDVSPGIITAHRAIWSTVTLLIIILIRRRLYLLKEKLRQPKLLLGSIFMGLLLMTNWLTYVWGTNNDRVVEVSLGYYILPLFMIVLGYFILKEELNKLQVAAVAIAVVGVIMQSIGIGSLPLPALGVSCSFAVYSVLKKQLKSDGFTSLIIEIGSIAPFAFIYLCMQESGVWSDGSFKIIGILMLTGAATIAPLLCFTEAAKRIPLSLIGMLQFIAPTGQFLLGVLYFSEKLNFTQVISFTLIWVAVSVYAYSKLKKNKNTYDQTN